MAESMRAIIVANRLPVKIYTENGKLKYENSPGGLVSGLADFLKQFTLKNQKIESVWVGWPGQAVAKKDQPALRQDLETQNHSSPIFLSQKQIDDYYLGFSNKTIWPFFHYFTEKSVFNQEYWESYQEVNRYFADQIAAIIQPGDVVFIQDYQLMLLPHYLRERFPTLPIGFFLHIPFPSYEVFRFLAEDVRHTLLEGLLGSDFIGFHTSDYSYHFLDNIRKLFDIKHTAKTLTFKDRQIVVDSVPLGIPFDKYALRLQNKNILKKAAQLKQHFKGQKLLFSVDRLDYSKGIKQRLLGYELFLKNNPNFHQKVTLILNAQPSRVEIDEYQKMKEEVDEAVGRINGQFGNIDWTPVVYQYTSLGFDDMLVRYLVSDIAVVTPLRDGMNLVSKEYVACKAAGKGVLILSETAGSAKELTQALLINPNNTKELAEAILQALTMPAHEQQRRMNQMHQLVKQFTSETWARTCLDYLFRINQDEILLTESADDNQTMDFLTDYMLAQKRLLFFDYDGTLVPFAEKPAEAKPPRELLTILKRLSEDFRNELVITSGRGKEILGKWLSFPKVALVAEHGAWIRERNQFYWQQTKTVSTDWKADIRKLFERFNQRLSKSFIEEKEFSLAWHYRMSDPLNVEKTLSALLDELQLAIENTNLEILKGNNVIEVKDKNITKGTTALTWLNKKKYDFILAIGDDVTDEELFSVLPENSWKIKVGYPSKDATFHIENYQDTRQLIDTLANLST